MGVQGWVYIYLSIGLSPSTAHTLAIRSTTTLSPLDPIVDEGKAPVGLAGRARGTAKWEWAEDRWWTVNTARRKDRNGSENEDLRSRSALASSCVCVCVLEKNQRTGGIWRISRLSIVKWLALFKEFGWPPVWKFESTSTHDESIT